MASNRIRAAVRIAVELVMEKDERLACRWHGACENTPDPAGLLRPAEHRKQPTTTMKTITKVFGLATLLTWSAGAQVTETTETKDTTEHADGSVTESTTTTTRTFDPALRTKVVKYFDTYKTEKYGLPPEIVTSVKVKEVPTAWRTSAIAPGVIVTEKERPYLVAAPPTLVKLLPAAEERKVRYYVAGGNVVAVDKEYKVVDSIHIPSIKYVEEE